MVIMNNKKSLLYKSLIVLAIVILKIASTYVLNGFITVVVDGIYIIILVVPVLLINRIIKQLQDNQVSYMVWSITISLIFSSVVLGLALNQVYTSTLWVFNIIVYMSIAILLLLGQVSPKKIRFLAVAFLSLIGIYLAFILIDLLSLLSVVNYHGVVQLLIDGLWLYVWLINYIDIKNYLKIAKF